MEAPALNTDLPIPARMEDGVNRARHQIASSGSFFTGVQRVAIAGVARAARGGQELATSPELEEVVAATAAKIATEAHALTAEDVDLVGDPLGYVELYGVVARATAIDTAARGVDAAPIVYPAPSMAPPSGVVAERAKTRSGLAPTVGAVGPTTALSAIPAEDAAQVDLHGALYLTYDEMGDPAIVKGLARWQLELVASRTSLINDCFF